MSDKLIGVRHELGLSFVLLHQGLQGILVKIFHTLNALLSKVGEQELVLQVDPIRHLVELDLMVFLLLVLHFLGLLLYYTIRQVTVFYFLDRASPFLVTLTPFLLQTNFPNLLRDFPFIRCLVLSLFLVYSCQWLLKLLNNNSDLIRLV